MKAIFKIRLQYQHTTCRLSGLRILRQVTNHMQHRSSAVLQHWQLLGDWSMLMATCCRGGTRIVQPPLSHCLSCKPACYALSAMTMQKHPCCIDGLACYGR